MSVETVNTIFDLNQSFPGSSELRSEGDDHLRNIKKGVVNTFLKGTFASRPSAGTSLRFYFATDTVQLFYDTGSAWVELTNQTDSITGVGRWTCRSTETSGWIWFTGRTLGHTGSGADLQGTNYQALYNIVKAYPPNAGTETWGVDLVTTPDCQKRILVAMDQDGTPDTDYDTLMETGGAKTVTIAEGQLPAHTHGPGTLAGEAALAGGHRHTDVPKFGAANTAGSGSSLFDITLEQWTDLFPDHTHSVSISTGTTASTGSGTAVDLKNPYIVFNFEVKL